MHPQTDAELALHLLHREQALLQPETRGNPSAVASLLTADFREFGSSGRIYTKESILTELANETPSPLTLTHFHLDRLSPTVALVTYRSHRTSPKRDTITALRSSLWVLEPDGHWRMHFHQGTKQP